MTFDITQLTTRTPDELFFRKNDGNDVRLGELVSNTEYAEADVIILGCPQDEGIQRNNGRLGAAMAPQAIRQQFYKLTDFGINKKIYDAGDTIIYETLEETHANHTLIVEQILFDDKKLIVLGGGNDISYADGAAMARVFGTEGWSALNIDAHFDVRADQPRNSGTPYRQLLDEKLVNPTNFYEVAYQTHSASRVYFEFLKNSGANLISLDEFQNFNFLFSQLAHKKLPVFWGFDVDAVRASDAPGVSAPSPIGLTAEEFCRLAVLAGETPDTKIVEFSEVNPNFDVDARTARLVAIAMHGFLRALNQRSQSI